MRRSFRIRLAACTVAACCAAPALAAQDHEFLPGTVRDPAVPSQQDVLGFATGERITTHRDVERRLAALDAASDRVRVETYGASVEGRALWLVFVSSPANLARLDAVRASMQRLADPRGVAEDELRRLADETPAFTWIACSVHGDEISPTDAALWLAWHLASARGDALVDKILHETIVVLDPLQNPDGRERFVFTSDQTRGRWPSAEPAAAERDQPWPAGRFNHALFDMNRDWFALTQPETRARVKAFLRHWPVVFVDAHEMGTNSSYYFGPPAEPLNPEISPAQHAWLLRYGKNNAAWFDRWGFDYFTREVFDSFYPGYGEGWPTFHGSIGMTFEESSVRGLVAWREDDTTKRYVDSVRRQVMAFLGTAETTARDKDEALMRFVEDRRGAAAEGERGAIKEYVLLPGRDPGRTADLAALLAFQGIEVRRLVAATTNGSVREHGGGGEATSRELPAGSFVVRLDQPAKRLALVLLARQQDMKPEFLQKQIEKEKRREDTEMYDVSAWSLPLTFGVECVATGSFTSGEAVLVDGTSLDEPAIEPQRFADATPARVAYVLPSARAASLRALAELLRAGARVHVAGKSFRIGERRFDPGSLIVKVAENPPSVHALVRALDAAFALDVLACNDSWVDEGVHFGSNDVKWVKPPRVAIAWDRPTATTSAGAVRWLLEWRCGQPVTSVRTDRLRSADLSRFDVLVLPDGGDYGDVLGKSGAERIADWVRAGGTLVTLGGGATRWLTGKDVALLASEAEKRTKPGDEKPEGSKPEDSKPVENKSDETKPDETKPDEAKPAAAETSDAETSKAKKPAYDYERAILPEHEDPAATPGALLRVELDPEEFAAFGAGDAVDVLSTDREIYLPLKLDQGRNVGVFAKRDALLRSGFAWEHKLDQLARKAWLVHQPHGKGHVVAFAEDPAIRGFCRATERLVLNAVFFGPAF
ncbi:MAG: peptidase M14 [Planctomycetes bacterium]|nr:peptidase M14 [Planctomycetota bacterium]